MLISLHMSCAKPFPAHCSPRSTGGKAKRFLPFMEGARSCAGQALAVMNLTATLAMMYGSFTFRLAEEVGMPSTDPCQQAAMIVLMDMEQEVVKVRKQVPCSEVF